MFREIEHKIQKWIEHDSGNHALLVTGARQVGKTYSIRNSLETLRKNYVEINFLTNPELKTIIDGSSDVKEILQKLKIFIGKKSVEYIFFDEVQECSEIITMIKFLIEEGSYKYILSGSLLGVMMNDLRSAPVGYLQTITMYPMSLKEFMIAIDTPEEIIELASKREEIDDFIHKVLIKRFYLYLVVGGMPAVVKAYLKKDDIVDAREEQKEILKLYQLDFTKYEKNAKLQLIDFYKSVPAQLNAQNQRFYLNKVTNIDSYRKAANNCIWLKDAGVVLPTYNVTDLTRPLIINEKRNLFKLFLSDVGLLSSYFTDNEILTLLSNPKDLDLGSLFENFVAQELKYSGYDLRYYNNKKIGEIDFVIEHNGKVTPIEVKSGKVYKKHQALTNAISSKNYDIDEGYVFCISNFEDVGDVHYCPIYSIMYLNEEKLDSLKKPYPPGYGFQF